jgi:predicted phosphate transport protein (TIGR00153 family)
MLSFLPKQPVYAEYFQKLNKHLLDIASLFAHFAPTFNNARRASKEAEKIEHKADEVTHQIIEQLNKTFITPFDREDIYRLAQEMDDIIDLVENVIHNIYLYELMRGDKYTKQTARVIHKDAKILNKLIRECFHKKKCTEHTNGFVVKINDLEEEGDQIFQDAIIHLFKSEKDPIKVIKWKDIYENLEQTIDKFQNISDTIQSIIVKSS